MWHFLPWCSDYHQSLIFPHKRKCGHVLSCQHKKNIRLKIKGLGDFPMFFYVISSESKRESLLEERLGAFWGWEAHEVMYTLVGSVFGFSLNPGLFEWSYDLVCIVPSKGRERLMARMDPHLNHLCDKNTHQRALLWKEAQCYMGRECANRLSRTRLKFCL